MFDLQNNLISLKDDLWFERQKTAGKTVSKVLKTLTKIIKDKTPNLSLIDLEKEAEKIIKDNGCIPTFLNYKPDYADNPFPSAICTSVNHTLVHGITTNYVLQNTDKISIDLGATFEGAIADAAYTIIYGDCSDEMTSLLQTCQNALNAGIEAAKVGNQIGAISYAIYKMVQKSPFSNITKFGGHGLDYDIPHASPFISNQNQKDNGIRIKPGLTIAIEPMVTIGNNSTYQLDDGWSIGSKTIGCHFEHSIFIKENQTVIMTEHGMKVGFE